MTPLARCTVILALVSIMAPLLPCSHAGDYDSAHRIEPGDPVSADVLNELFDAVKEAERSMTVDDLLGTWKGTSYAGAGSAVPEWRTHPPQGYLVLTNVTVTFIHTEEGTNWITTSAPNPFYTTDSNSANMIVEITEGSLWVENTCPYTIDKIGKDRIRLSRHAIYAYQPRLLTLDRQNIPPEKPKLLSASVSDLDVVLLWADRSDDETGFAIHRRDSLSGSYSNILNVASNVMCCTNAVPASGIYWYRILATNGCGCSVGSNVKRVIVP